MDVSLQAGRVVGEHWLLSRRLGSDVASRFWEAEDLRGGANVAVEFAHADVAGADARLRFSRETRRLLKFRHPNVARTLHRGIAGDSLAFAVTELLCGEDLVARLAREPALGLFEAAQILDVVCRVVNRLDASNIPQLVIEPKQVFFAVEHLSARIVKLLHAGLPYAGSRAGSPYLSPERASSAESVACTREPIDEAVQVWAIGVLGYRMLAGELPFAPGTRDLDPDWSSRLVRLGDPPEALPRELDEWFRTAIHRDPAQRFGSVEQAGLAFGHIATTYALNAARVRREHSELREAAGGSVVTGMGRIVEARGKIEAPRIARRAADESGVVRVAIPESPSLAKRAPEAVARAGHSEPVAAHGQGRALREQRAAIACAVLLGMLGGFVLRGAIIFVQEHSRISAALRTAAPALAPLAAHSLAPAAPLEPPAPALQPSAAPAEADSAAAPQVKPATVKMTTESPARTNPPREVRANPPKRVRLGVSNEATPSEPADALLPAAPAPIDTTPIQVYRGF